MMSDDYTDTSGEDALRREDASDSRNAVLRVAIRARSQDAADALWQGIDKRLRKKAKMPVLRSQAGDADVVVFLLFEEDFSGDDAAHAKAAEIAASVAPLNILAEPAVRDVELRQQVIETLAVFAQRPGYVRVASQSESEQPEAALRRIAKAVSKLLPEGPADPEPDVAASRDHAERKAQKRAKRRVERQKLESGVLPGATAVGAVERADTMDRLQKKAERRATKKNNKAEKRSKQSTVERREKKPFVDEPGHNAKAFDGTAGSSDTVTEKPAKKTERKGAKPGSKRVDESSRILLISIAGLSESEKVGLLRTFEAKSTGVAVKQVPSENRCDVAIYGFDDVPLDAKGIGRQIEAIVKQHARVRIFLEGADPSSDSLEEKSRAIAMLASACGGSLVRMGSKFKRYGDIATVADGHDMIADSILGIVSAALPKHSLARPAPSPPTDLIEARAWAISPPDFLVQLRWNEPVVPKLLSIRASKGAMGALIDEKLVLPREVTLDLRPPIVWPVEIPDRVTGAQLLGLEFLTGPLSYWYSKASGRSNEQIAEIDTVLKERGLKASEILSRAEKIMTAFVGNYPAVPTSSAWREDAVWRRVRVFLLYVLCCKMALKRHIRFDTDAFAIAFRELLDLIEILRADDFYKPGTSDGFEQDCLLIGLGLALRGTAYGDRLLSESLERFRTLQLDVGLTTDGVWRAGSFAEHCSLLAMLRTFIGDFGKSDAALIEPFTSVAKKMTVFAEAMLKSNGEPPAIDGSKQRSYAAHLSGARHALAQAGGKSVAKSKIMTMPRITETYVFRDAQYFISHSTQKVSAESSLVAFHADRSAPVKGDPGGVTLVFAHGETDLLVRAAPAERSENKGRSLLFDPALRNGYHIDGAGFLPGAELKYDAARIVKSWRGPGWAAARSIDEINSAASIGRVVIHLKAVHALIVVDELESRGGKESEFEQHWHVAPGLAAPLSRDALLRFASSAGGMTVAHDPQGAIAIEAEGEGSRIRRNFRLASGVTASLFQWTPTTEAATIEIAHGEAGGWVATASGKGFDVRLILSGDEFRCEGAGHS